MILINDILKVHLEGPGGRAKLRPHRRAPLSPMVLLEGLHIDSGENRGKMKKKRRKVVERMKKIYNGRGKLWKRYENDKNEDFFVTFLKHWNLFQLGSTKMEIAIGKKHFFLPGKIQEKWLCPNSFCAPANIWVHLPDHYVIMHDYVH